MLKNQRQSDEFNKTYIAVIAYSTCYVNELELHS